MITPFRAKGSALLKKILIALFAFLFALACTGIIFRYRSSQRMDELVSIIERDNPEKKTISEALLLINESENHYQAAITRHDKKEFFEYKRKLHLALDAIDSIVRAKTDMNFSGNHEVKDSLAKLFRVKEILSDSFFVLRSNFIDLDKTAEASVTGKTPQQVMDSVKKLGPSYSASEINITRTEIPAAPRKKRGLFRRIGDAFANRQEPEAINRETITINNRKTDSAIVYMKSVLAKNGAMLGDVSNRVSYLSNLTARLLLANREITGKLRVLVTRLESVSGQVALQLKAIARNEYQSHKILITIVSIIALAFVGLLSLLLVHYIHKMYIAKWQLEKENEAVNILLTEKRDLLAIISHEIRNPLNNVLGFTAALKTTNPSRRQAEMIESAEVSGNMLLSTVNDLLDMSKLENGTFRIAQREFNPYTIIRQTIQATKINAEEKKLDVRFSFTGDKDLYVVGDSCRLRQVIVNLVTNAIKFTGEGTVIIKASLAPKCNTAELSVLITDTGIGMTVAQQEKLFSKYYRTDAANGVPGAGLGLYICHQLVKLQNGNITVNSKPGKGTCISFVIPYSFNSRIMQNTCVQELAYTDFSEFAGKRLVVVDDNGLNLKLVETMVKPWHIQVALMNRGDKALDYLLQNGADMIISDLRMPGMNGVELMRELKKNPCTSHIPIIVSTGEEITKKELCALKQSGFAGGIVKPFNQSQLAEAMHEVMHSVHEA